jgi:Rrf2 family protein
MSEDPDFGRYGAGVRVTAKVDYAVRAALVLARAWQADSGAVKGDRIGAEQKIPVKYLENILSELRQSGLVRSQRGADGGYWLAKAPEQIAVADIIRAVEGPLATVRGERAEQLDYDDCGALQEMWVAVRASLRAVLERVTLADVVSGHLPASTQALVDDPASWV